MNLARTRVDARNPPHHAGGLAYRLSMTVGLGAVVIAMRIRSIQSRAFDTGFLAT